MFPTGAFVLTRYDCPRVVFGYRTTWRSKESRNESVLNSELEQIESADSRRQSVAVRGFFESCCCERIERLWTDFLSIRRLFVRMASWILINRERHCMLYNVIKFADDAPSFVNKTIACYWIFFYTEILCRKLVVTFRDCKNSKTRYTESQSY